MTVNHAFSKLLRRIVVFAVGFVVSGFVFSQTEFRPLSLGLLLLAGALILWGVVDFFSNLSPDGY